MELIRELCSIEGRGSGTDAERRAANVLARRLKGIGRSARIEPTYVHPQYALVHAAHAALAIAGSVLATSYPAAGFALVFVTAVSTYLDLNTRAYLLRTLFFRRASQNVVSPGTRPEAPLRLLLVANYEAPRSGWVFGERGVRRERRLGARGRVLLGPWRILFWCGMAPLLPIIGARMAGLDGTWLSVLQLVPTILLAICAFLLIDVALSRATPGAYANASGVAAALSAAERIESQNLAPNLDLWVVLPGAGECQAEGMRAFIRADHGRLERERTVIVNLDSVSYGEVHYATSEGGAVSVSSDPDLVGLCEALASASPALPADPDAGTVARPVRSPRVTDSQAALARRRRAITITGLSDGLSPPWRRTHEDTPDRVVEPALARATDFVVDLARLLDREAGRAAGISQS